MEHLTTEEIAERVWLSIADRRLLPGTRLKETELAEVFGVSRARIRQVLALLERDGLIVIESNKGAVVAKPSVQDAKDIFHIRSAVEQRVLARLVDQLDAAKLVEMFEHVAKERIANNSGNQRDIIKLSGGFHVMLAELAEADFLCRLMRDLVSRTSLITAAFRDSNRHNCGPDEHEEILLHLKNRDLAAAQKAMAAHLAHVESELKLIQDREPAKSLRDALG
ncbi:GntR family transcriptional regulator [Paracoccus sp. M683]|uniref:GntR family transcriptional regulator n=1 Tax=Paracoccus sp. M683 TaxID=2594268 RepID=UPI00117DF1DE|nr:GntR family transcriptional regulator [Paracoccus sp. M683]TRW97866.1 GntR family transcriptional regulator [Paracoccus sp. M683]